MVGCCFEGNEIICPVEVKVQRNDEKLKTKT